MRLRSCGPSPRWFGAKASQVDLVGCWAKAIYRAIKGTKRRVYLRRMHGRLDIKLSDDNVVPGGALRPEAVSDAIQPKRHGRGVSLT